MPATPDSDLAVARIAVMIGEPARARILVSLLDGSTRTGVELAIIAGVSPSTASVHLGRLEAAHLIRAHRAGRHCYYGLGGSQVARVLKDMNAFAVGAGADPRVRDGVALRDDMAACDDMAVRDGVDVGSGRRCYDHLGGALGIALHEGYVALGWLARRRRNASYQVSPAGVSGFAGLGVDVAALRGLRRRLAYGCPDWREGQCHLGGALGAAITRTALERGWVVQQGKGRGVRLTDSGRRELLHALAIEQS